MLAIFGWPHPLSDPFIPSKWSGRGCLNGKALLVLCPRPKNRTFPVLPPSPFGPTSSGYVTPGSETTTIGALGCLSRGTLFQLATFTLGAGLVLGRWRQRWRNYFVRGDQVWNFTSSANFEDAIKLRIAALKRFRAIDKFAPPRNSIWWWKKHLGGR